MLMRPLRSTIVLGMLRICWILWAVEQQRRPAGRPAGQTALGKTIPSGQYRQMWKCLISNRSSQSYCFYKVFAIMTLERWSKSRKPPVWKLCLKIISPKYIWSGFGSNEINLMNFGGIWIEIGIFPLKLYWNMSSVKWRLLCSSLNVLMV